MNDTNLEESTISNNFHYQTNFVTTATDNRLKNVVGQHENNTIAYSFDKSPKHFSHINYQL